MDLTKFATRYATFADISCGTQNPFRTDNEHKQEECPMNMQALFEQANSGAIDQLHLLSLEGGIYLLEIYSDERSELLRDADGQPLKMRSVEDARKHLKGIKKTPFFLVQRSAFSEMCGLDDLPLMPLYVPISLTETR
jgi:hypothetical protein